MFERVLECLGESQRVWKCFGAFGRVLERLAEFWIVGSVFEHLGGCWCVMNILEHLG